MPPTKRKLLIVDDDEAILQLYKDVLASRYAVTTVNDWVLGVDLLLQQRFDVLILDLRMSLLDPVEFIKKIRADGNLIPILVCSAYPNLRDRMAGAQVEAILAKPFDIMELERTVSQLIADSDKRKA